MSTIIARLIASIVLMLSLPVLFALLMFVVAHTVGPRTDEWLVAAVTLTCAAFAMLAWIGLWYTHVHWTPMRIVGTVGVALSLAVLATIVGMMIASMSRFDGGIFGIIFGGMCWALGWFGLTPLVWKETGAERNARLQQITHEKGVACPVCSYNLTGLREAKCPECGASYTLDQLYAAITESQEPISRDSVTSSA